MGKTTNKQMPGIMVTKVRDLTPQEREALTADEKDLMDGEEADKMIDTFYSELDETDNCVYEFSPEPSEELTVEDWAILYRMVENLGHETAIEKAYTVGYLRGFKAGYTSEPGGPLS